MKQTEAMKLALEVIKDYRDEYGPWCSDFDDECVDVKNKTICWLYQPECGLCPFLKGEQ